MWVKGLKLIHSYARLLLLHRTRLIDLLNTVLFTSKVHFKDSLLKDVHYSSVVKQWGEWEMVRIKGGKTDQSEGTSFSLGHNNRLISPN